MAVSIAFIRGINVGGKNKLPMKELREHMEEAGFSNVQTYIQSGNMVFSHGRDTAPALARSIAKLIEDRQGFNPSVVVLAREALQAAADGNPFADEENLEKTLHLYFMNAPPTAPDTKKMDSIKAPTESYTLQGKVFYLHTPDGFGKSKLAARVEKLLGVDATARNWRTVNAVLAMATEY